MMKSPKQLAGKRYRLHRIDGVKDVKIGNASVEAREQGNAHVTDKNLYFDESGFSDLEERRKRRPSFYY